MRTFSILVILILSMVRPAVAQEWTERIWATANGGVQTAGTSFSDSFDIQQFVETGTVKTDYPAKTGTVVEGSAGVRFWKRLGAGVAITKMSSRGDAAIDARIPHPFFDNQPRTVQGSTSVTRNETDVHFQISYLANLTPRLRMILSAGPSILSIEQTLVTDVQYSQVYPYDTATFTGATTRRAKATANGFNTSADAFWMFSRNIGAGGVVRYTRATADEDAGNGRTISVDAGGVQAGFGVRVMF
jgi:hypothetical protein